MNMNEATTVRVDKQTYKEIKLLADKCHQNMQHVVELAIKHYKKLQYFEELNRSFAKLKENEEAWAVTLADDMEKPDALSREL
jgi:predicted transcriptional regulator